MYIGLDFGTSNCSIGTWEAGQPRLLPLAGDSPLLPSALYTTKKVIEPPDVDRVELDRRITAAKREQTRQVNRAQAAGRPCPFAVLSEEQIERREQGVMRREVAEQVRRETDTQSIQTALYADSTVLFGEPALRAHMREPTQGFFMRSPKTFLGSQLPYQTLEMFTEIVTLMLGHIKAQADVVLGVSTDRAVLGRPVKFHGTQGEAGNTQAVAVIERACLAVGFSDVEFVLEPVAAAMDYERQLDRDRVALIFDAGGGTTDVTMMRLGPSFRDRPDRDEDILGVAGDRIRGNDLDIKLAMRTLMPHLGKDTLQKSGLPLPATAVWDAVCTNDIPAQDRFYRRQDLAGFVRGSQEPSKVARLLRLQKQRLTHRFNHSAELAKIHLSDRDPITLPLGYLDEGLAVSVSRSDFTEAIEQDLAAFERLIADVRGQAGLAPDVVYVTGGTGKSPVVEHWLRGVVGAETEVVVGDLFGGITAGLATIAHHRFA